MPDPNERLQDCPLNDACGDDCEDVFDRIVVSHAIKGPTRIMWELLPTFAESGPFTFQLQVGETTNPNADDWENVGLPVIDQFFAYDFEQRVWAKENWTHYRLILSTPRGTYYSPAIGGMGILDRRSWRIAREEIRQKLQSMRVGTGGQRGYLLKHRWTGEDCPVCLDYQTKEVRNPNCPSCFGTGKKCGYYYPVDCVWAELSPRSKHVELDGIQSRGTISDMSVMADMVMTELLSERDVWVGAKTDDRYYVHRVVHQVEVRGVPVLAKVELRLIPFSSIIYSIPIPQQLSQLGLT